MNSRYRDIILVKPECLVREKTEASKIEYLNAIIARVDTMDGFCKVHELVRRHRITANKDRLLFALRYEKEKPFRFFLNKN